MLKSLANPLKLLGIILISLSLISIFQRYSPTRLSFAFDPDSQNISSINSSQTPQRIQIENLNINLPIEPSSIKNSKLEISSRGVSYLTSTPLPGQTGNSILYGHNYTNILGNLTKIKPGEIVRIYYTDGSFKDFEVSYTLEVSPKDSKVLENSTDTRITLYTCSGFLDTKRFVAVAISN